LICYIFFIDLFILDGGVFEGGGVGWWVVVVCGGGGGLVDLQMPVTFDDGQSKSFKPILVKF